MGLSPECRLYLHQALILRYKNRYCTYIKAGTWVCIIMKNEFQMINLELMKFLQSTVNIKYVTLLINFITESFCVLLQ